MPTYDYKCKNCKYSFEHFQSITSKALISCPKCNKETLQRMIGAGGGIIFKGDGFYETDYKKKNQDSSKE